MMTVERRVAGVSYDHCECGRWKNVKTNYCNSCRRVMVICPIPACGQTMRATLIPRHLLMAHPEPVPQWDPEDFDPGGEHGGPD